MAIIVKQGTKGFKELKCKDCETLFKEHPDKFKKMSIDNGTGPIRLGFFYYTFCPSCGNRIVIQEEN